jgi:hypothetical protein
MQVAEHLGAISGSELVVEGPETPEKSLQLVPRLVPLSPSQSSSG